MASHQNRLKSMPSSSARRQSSRRIGGVAFIPSQSEEVLEKQESVLEEVHSVLGKLKTPSARGKPDPRLQRWEVDEGHQKMVEAAKSTSVLDLGLLSNPLACNTLHSLAGYKNVPYQKPTMNAVKPPWNFESIEDQLGKHMPRNAKNATSKTATGEPELQVTRDMKKQIQDLDKRIGKIDAFRQGGTRSARRRPEAKEGGFKKQKMRRDHAQEPQPDKGKAMHNFDDQARKQARQLNSMTKELLDNSNSKCISLIKQTFKTLLEEELENIAKSTAMSKESKRLLSKAVKAAVMRRVKIEIEKMKLFDWPEDAVRQYASEHIKAEKEKRHQEMTLNEARMKRESSFKRVKPSVFSVAAISPRKLPAVATTTANKAMRGSNGQNAALALDKVLSKDRQSLGSRERNGLGSRSGLGSRGSLPSRSSVRAPGTPLGVVVEDDDIASSLRAVAEDGNNDDDDDADEGAGDAGRITARVVDILRGADQPDAPFLGGISKLYLGTELIGRNYIKALQSILPMLTNVTVLDLSRNDLGAGSFHGLIGSMYRAQSLPLEDLDLSMNSFGADGGNWGMAQLAVYLGKVALHPGISGHRIRRLNLRACMLGDAGAIKLAGALPSVPTLQELDLSENAIGDAGVRVLGHALSEGKIRMLGWLSLAYNDIGAVGSHWIAHALETGCQLRILNLSWNPHVGQDGIERLAQSLLNNTVLEELFLEACEIGDSAIDVIVLLSWVNKTMRALHIQTNNFSLHGKRRLWKLLSHQETPYTGSWKAGQQGSHDNHQMATGIAFTAEQLNQRIESKNSVYRPEAAPEGDPSIGKRPLAARSKG